MIKIYGTLQNPLKFFHLSYDFHNRTFKVLSILILLSISVISSAQNLQWAKSIGGIGNDHGNCVTSDLAGNVYSAGHFEGTVDFDPGPSILNYTSLGGSDIFITKFDSAGNFIWVRIMGGSSYETVTSIVTDLSGNIYSTGNFDGITDFNPGSATYNLSSAGGSDIFVLKLSNSGNFIWANRFGGSDLDQANSIANDSIGNIYVAGSSNQSGTSCNFISKWNSFGFNIWYRTFGTSSSFGSSYISSVAIDKSGNVYTTGYFFNVVDFDPDITIVKLTAHSSYPDAFILKLNSLGNYLWVKQIGGYGGEVGCSITIDAKGYIYSTGNFDGNVDFDPGSGFYYLNGNFTDTYISKLDSSGNFVWAKKFEGNDRSIGRTITADLNGQIYIVGSFRGSTDFDPGINKYTLNSSSYNFIYIASLDSSGNFLWAGGIGSYNDANGSSLFLDKYGNLYCTGFYKSIADFDIGVGVYRLTPNGEDDFFVIKLNSKPSPAGIISGINSLCYGDSKTFSIDPVSGATGYAWSVPTDAIISSGQNTSSIIMVIGTNNGVIQVTPYNSNGNGISSSSNVTAVFKPMVTIQPLNQIVSKDSNVYFVSGSSNNTSKFQWQQNSGNSFVNLNNAGQFSGAKKDTLVISLVSLNLDNHTYRCIITNGQCSDTSNAALLNVKYKNGFFNKSLESYLFFYPNPAKNFITIESELSAINSKYCIIDALGREVFFGVIANKTTVINVSFLPPGIYNLQIADYKTNQLIIFKN